MTQQFEQPNINQTVPRGARTISASDAVGQDDDLLVVDSSAAQVDLTLYPAAQYPGMHLFIKAATGATNPVVITPAAGETIDNAASLSLTADNEGVLLKAFVQGWVIIAGTGSSGGGINAPDFQVVDEAGTAVDRIEVQTGQPLTTWTIVGKNWDAGDPVISVQEINGLPTPTTLIVPTQLTNDIPGATAAGSITFTLPGPIADNEGPCVLVITRATGEQASFLMLVTPEA